MRAHDEAEVAVVGGGPAASAVATTLCRAGIEVTVLDAAVAGGTFRVGEGAPPGTERTVRAVFGAEAAAFDPTRHLPSYGNRSAWGSDVLVDTDFLFNPFGHGWHLDRVAFDEGLLAAAERAGARVRRGCAVRAAERDGNGWRLRIGDEGGADDVVRAGLVCDASGRRAVVARGQGATFVAQDRLVAVVAVLGALGDAAAGAAAASPVDATTTVEAVEDGWWYTAPLPAGRRVVAMLSDGDLIDPGRMRTDAGFWEALRGTHHIRGCVDSLGMVVGPRLVAAATSHLARPVGPGWLAVGDAAAAFDPLSSQGILSALSMGARAGEVIAERRRTGGGAGDTSGSAFESYERASRELVEQYRATHREIYAAERRWPDAPFWARRH